MSLTTVKNFVQKLPLNEKILLAGTLLIALSMFLPVYSDVSTWGKGVRYLGITGPLSLIGVSLLLLSTFTLLCFLDRKLHLNKINVGFEKSAKFLSFQTILLLTIMSSIYLNKEFGINIEIKELRMGIFAGFIGAIINIVGLYTKGELNTNIFENIVNEEKHFEPLIKLPDQIEDRIHQVLDHLKERKQRMETAKESEQPVIISQGDTNSYKNESEEEKKLSPKNYNLRMDL